MTQIQLKLAVALVAAAVAVAAAATFSTRIAHAGEPGEYPQPSEWDALYESLERVAEQDTSPPVPAHADGAATSPDAAVAPPPAAPVEAPAPPASQPSMQVPGAGASAPVALPNAGSGRSGAFPAQALAAVVAMAGASALACGVAARSRS